MRVPTSLRGDAGVRDSDGSVACGRLLGSGAHGAVRLGQHVQTGECECSQLSPATIFVVCGALRCVHALTARAS